jgi:cobalt-precorrin 5A hydrolase
VVREIAPHLVNKASDPAVVSLGQDGRFVISLLSGHLGGGNALSEAVAALTGGTAVINTATDIAGVPALEMTAREHDLTILDLKPLSGVSRRLSEGKAVPLFDPLGFLDKALEPWSGLFPRIAVQGAYDPGSPGYPKGPSVYVEHRLMDFPPGALVMVPPFLALGVGCHRGIEFSELWGFLDGVFAEEGLSPYSAAVVATADIRKDEPAFLELARWLRRPFRWFTKGELAGAETPNPSETVLKRIGVPSVCEAAAMLAARTGSLLITKRKSRAATMAAARMSSTWSALDPRALPE